MLFGNKEQKNNNEMGKRNSKKYKIPTKITLNGLDTLLLKEKLPQIWRTHIPQDDGREEQGSEQEYTIKSQTKIKHVGTKNERSWV